MRIRLLTISHKLPAWIETGYAEYIKRLPPAYSIELINIPAEKRKLSYSPARMLQQEGKKMLSLIKASHHVVALDMTGEQWSTEILSANLSVWQQAGVTVDLLVGGADGLAPACLERANIKWSLSKLTFPHLLVKLIIAEQIYRAYTILMNHPYHR